MSTSKKRNPFYLLLLLVGCGAAGAGLVEILDPGPTQRTADSVPNKDGQLPAELIEVSSKTKVGIETDIERVSYLAENVQETYKVRNAQRYGIWTQWSEIAENLGVEANEVKKLIFFEPGMIGPLGQLGGIAIAVAESVPDEARALPPGLRIYEVEEAGKLKDAGVQKWDLITAVNGKTLEYIPATGAGPFATLGTVLDQVENNGGALTLSVKRGNTSFDVSIAIDKRGSYTGKQYETNNKALNLLDLCLKNLSQMQKPDGLWLCGYGSRQSTYLAVLAYLSEGSRKYDDNLTKAVQSLISNEKPRGWTWDQATKVIALAEYFWATGDMKVYDALQYHTDLLVTDYVSPYGTCGHKLGVKGTYNRQNFGGPYALTCLALALSEKCGCAIYKQRKDVAMERAQNNDKANTLSYAGEYGGRYNKAGEPQLGESGFVTAATALALDINGSSPEVVANMAQNLAHNHHMINYIHCSPCLGMIWGTLALNRLHQEGYRAHMDYRRWWLTLSHTRDHNIFYIPPRRARLGSSGGGWAGDNILNLPQVAAIQNAIVLTAHRNNLLVTGNSKIGWRNGRDSDSIRADIASYHQKRINSKAAEFQSQYRAGSKDDAIISFKYIRDYYLPSDYMKQSEYDKLIAAVNNGGDSAEIEKAMSKIDEVAHLTWGKKNLRGDQGVLKDFLKKYPESDLSSAVQMQLVKTSQLLELLKKKLGKKAGWKFEWKHGTYAIVDKSQLAHLYQEKLGMKGRSYEEIAAHITKLLGTTLQGYRIIVKASEAVVTVDLAPKE